MSKRVNNSSSGTVSAKQQKLSFKETTEPESAPITIEPEDTLAADLDAALLADNDNIDDLMDFDDNLGETETVPETAELVGSPKAAAEEDATDKDEVPEATEEVDAAGAVVVAEPAAAPAPKQETFDMSLSLQLATAKPLCVKCGFEVDPFKCQLRTKCGGVFTCNLCHTRGSMLSKKWPGWSAEFKLLDAEQMQTFWREAGKVSNGQQLSNALIQTLVNKRVDTVRAKLSGTWLPLSVYERQGFDIADIESKCQDKKEHPILGMTYRVQLAELGRESCEEVHRVQVLKNLQRPKIIENGDAEGSAAAADKHEPKADDISDNSSSESSNSSSSSSSSSSHKKKSKKHKNKDKKNRKSKKNKKAKKCKKDKNDKHGKKDKDESKDNSEKQQQGKPKGKDAAATKAKAAKEELDRTKQLNKERRAIDERAKRICTKVANPIYQLELAMKDKLIQKVASFALDAAAASLKQLTKMRTDSQNVLKNANKPVSFDWTLEDVQAAVTEAGVNSKTLDGMLAGARTYFKN